MGALPESNSIDWSRLAEPQADQYDTDVILRLASTTTSPGRPEPYRRTPVGNSPAVFDGQVAVRHIYRSLPEFAALSEYPDAPLEHSNIAAAAEYVRVWPTAYRQCQRLLEAIHPATHPGVPLESNEVYRGSLCHSYERLFGTMWATVFCSLGLAEAMVHEVAHQKLRALGVSVESATAVVGNDPSELYVSPIIKDRQRPMTAVLHAEYSYVHVTALDLRLLDAERDAGRREVLAGVLERNLSRIEEGYEIIRRHFKPGENGCEFMEGFFGWTEKTIESARNALARAPRQGAGGTRTAGVEHRTGADGPPSAPAAQPRIDTSVNTILTPDRAVEVLLTVDAPRIVLLGNVLSDEECDALIEYCEPRLERSLIVADPDGTVAAHENRTSRGVELRHGETELVARIEARLAALTRWPAERSEGLQVLRYDIGEEYRPHCDWINSDMPGLSEYLEHGGQRLATFILYLSDVEAGGGTSFPAIGLEVKPRKGGAVFFANTDSEYVPDQLSLHAGSPVCRGVKFAANKWLRQFPC